MSNEARMRGANLVEVFSSIQGEGTHVGTTTLFVRFGACDLRCRWCDSPQTWEPASQCRIEIGRCSGEFETRPNPVSVDVVIAAEQPCRLGHEMNHHRDARRCVRRNHDRNRL